MVSPAKSDEACDKVIGGSVSVDYFKNYTVSSCVLGLKKVTIGYEHAAVSASWQTQCFEGLKVSSPQCPVEFGITLECHVLCPPVYHILLEKLCLCMGKVIYPRHEPPE